MMAAMTDSDDYYTPSSGSASDIDEENGAESEGHKKRLEVADSSALVETEQDHEKSASALAHPGPTTGILLTEYNACMHSCIISRNQLMYMYKYR